ncbi:DUF6702 family protein [Christiangramia forsetii]|uniref:Secreted protein n=2 Tax=Christiangramia forsetii TaxID=411153 RepID=A0M4Y6_CHRFK|nr:DUF6702 family protein [Christiangramia forsetii]GGG22335.1 hypothetical protein GCM10011532_01700 [Christiangramia forsetii]CAL67681.1 secreted protein [Christiangramia forsetii KT0803]
MKKTFVLFFALIFLSSFVSNTHETYLSVTEIEYNKDKKSLQIISRVFIDDFEDVLSKRYQKDISLSYKEDLEENQDIMEKYLKKKLKVTVDEKLLNLKLLGSKFDADQIVLFIESKNMESFRKVKVENLILTDLFDAQKNITHVKKGETIESMLLTKAKASNTVIF